MTHKNLNPYLKSIQKEMPVKSDKFAQNIPFVQYRFKDDEQKEGRMECLP